MWEADPELRVMAAYTLPTPRPCQGILLSDVPAGGRAERLLQKLAGAGRPAAAAARPGGAAVPDSLRGAVRARLRAALGRSPAAAAADGPCLEAAAQVLHVHDLTQHKVYVP